MGARPAITGNVDTVHFGGMPYVGHPTDNTLIMAVLCNLRVQSMAFTSRQSARVFSPVVLRSKVGMLR